MNDKYDNRPNSLHATPQGMANMPSRASTARCEGDTPSCKSAPRCERDMPSCESMPRYEGDTPSCKSMPRYEGDTPSCKSTPRYDPDMPRRAPCRSFMRRLPGYACRTLIAAVGLSIVAFAFLIALPLLPFSSRNR